MPETKIVYIYDKKYTYYDVGSGEKTLVFLHGLAAGKEATWNMYSELTNNYRCIYIDLPGHNGIPLDSIESISDIAEYVEQLINQLNPDNLYVLGFSLGGLVALELAKLQSMQQKLKGLIVWASPVLGFKKGISKKAQLVYHIMKAAPDELFEKVCTSQHLDRLRRGIGIKLNKVEADLAANFPRAVRVKMTKMIEGWKYVHGSNVPKLYVYGSDDPIISTRNCRFIKSTGEMFCDVVELPKAGHYGAREAWDIAIEEVKKFVN